MAIADDRQRYMPLPDDRLPGRCQVLAYPEAVLLVNPTNPEHKGEVIIPYSCLLFIFNVIVYLSLFGKARLFSPC